MIARVFCRFVGHHYCTWKCTWCHRCERVVPHLLPVARVHSIGDDLRRYIALEGIRRLCRPVSSSVDFKEG